MTGHRPRTQRAIALTKPAVKGIATIGIVCAGPPALCSLISQGLQLHEFIAFLFTWSAISFLASIPATLLFLAITAYLDWPYPDDTSRLTPILRRPHDVRTRHIMLAVAATSFAAIPIAYLAEAIGFRYLLAPIALAMTSAIILLIWTTISPSDQPANPN